jgi:hypothetical protein
MTSPQRSTDPVALLEIIRFEMSERANKRQMGPSCERELRRSGKGFTARLPGSFTKLTIMALLMLRTRACHHCASMLG